MSSESVCVLEDGKEGRKRLTKGNERRHVNAASCDH